MGRFLKNFDPWILISVLILTSLGISIIWSVAPSKVSQQIVYFLGGLFFFLLFSQIDFQIYKNFGVLFYPILVLFLLLTFIIGSLTRGTMRWVDLGIFRLQPSELVKPLFIIFFASIISSYSPGNFKYVICNFLLLIIPLFLVFKQPDLGNSMVIFLVWFGLMIGGGLTFSFLIFHSSFFILILPLFWFFLKDYQKKRIITFLNPGFDPLGAGYNAIQAMITVGSGQFFGRGLGQGTQSHLLFLPEYHTDFIFASLAEELGFLGVGLLLIIYFFLLWRILLIASKSSSSFGSLICLGVFFMLSVQLFINIGMNLGLLPITGITLPLISYGGSSLISTFISLGIVENIARQKNREKWIEIR